MTSTIAAPAQPAMLDPRPDGAHRLVSTDVLWFLSEMQAIDPEAHAVRECYRSCVGDQMIDGYL